MAETKPSPIQLAAARPLSPHLMIYRPMLTMMMSMPHRLPGVPLSAGTPLLAWYLVALAAGPDSFAPVSAVFGSLLGRLVLFLFTWALFHHFLGGVRHFVWDLGYGMGEFDREVLAWGTLIGGIVLTLVVWAAALLF